MPVFLKKLKQELQKDKKLKGVYTPPNFVQRYVKDYPVIDPKTFDVVGAPGIKALQFTAIVPTDTNGPGSLPNYKVSCWFYNVDFYDNPENNLSVPIDIETSKGWIVKYHRPPSFNKNQAKLKCQCADFRFRFEWELSEIDGLIGGPRKYTKIGR